MKSILSCILVSAALFSGCSPTSSDISGQPTPNNQIYIEGGAYLNSPSATGKAPYTVYCTLQYTDTSKSNSDFNTAEITVNGVSLVRIYNDGYFQNTRAAMSFSEGDSLSFVIKHPRVGTVKGVVYVPPSVTDVSVSPGLSQANLPNSETTFNLSWAPATVSYYYVQAAGYNYWQTIMVADTAFATLSNNATIMLMDNTGSPCPYVYFRVISYGSVSLDGFAAGSGLGVTGAYFVANSNMPNVSSNMRVTPSRGK